MGFLVILLGLPVTTSGYGSGAATLGSASVAGSTSVASSATSSVSGVAASGVVSASDSETEGGNLKALQALRWPPLFSSVRVLPSCLAVVLPLG